jgi:hypothetical protein
MKIVIIGIVMVVVGCIILGWLIKESYKNLKGASTKLTGSLLRIHVFSFLEITTLFDVFIKIQVGFRTPILEYGNNYCTV